MASEYLKNIMRDGLPETLDRYLGGSTGYEPAPTEVPSEGGQGIQDKAQQPVDTTPGESPQLIRGLSNKVTYTGAGVALVAGVGLLVWAVK